MNSLKKCVYVIVVLLTLIGCNRNFHSTISPSNFLVADWYTFEDFRYRGSLSEGLPNGLGTIEYNNGTKVSGRFVNGVLNDQEATYSIPQIGTIVGVVVSGKLVSGQIQYSNGDIYLGKIQSYIPNGSGVFIKSNSDVFEGKFQNGKFITGDLLVFKSGSTFKGSFKDWKPDGEVLEIKSDGEANTLIYSNGSNVTDLVLDGRASNNVKSNNESEIKEIEEVQTQLFKEKKELTEDFSQKKAELEENGGDMYDRCACTLHLKLCLMVSSGSEDNSYSYSSYYEEFNLPEPYGPIYSNIYSVSVPIGSSKNTIKQAFLNRIEFVSECVKWNADRDNYELLFKDKLANLSASHQQFLFNVEARLNDLERQKENTYLQQESEKQMRQDAELFKLKQKMKEKAQQEAELRKEFCKKNPDCCLTSKSIEKLKASKQYSPCATQQ